jgi:hypothetical protein
VLFAKPSSLPLEGMEREGRRKKRKEFKRKEKKRKEFNILRSQRLLHRSTLVYTVLHWTLWVFQ